MSQSLIIIVGMGAGVSFAAANRFARENFQVAMIGRDRESLADFEKKFRLRAFPPEVSSATRLMKIRCAAL